MKMIVDGLLKKNNMSWDGARFVYKKRGKIEGKGENPLNNIYK